MKTRLLVAAIVLAGAGASAHAEPIVGKTRAQVHAELVEAQRNGLRYVTDVSYPDVSPMHAPRLAKERAEAGKRADVPQPQLMADAHAPAARAVSGPVAEQTNPQPHCEGPVSFCKPYFGS